MMTWIEFSKGHGAGNDFVIVADRDDALEIQPAQVRAICDRHFGIGADGLLRVVKAPQMSEEPSVEWFMDYRNADGSIAEMCGNGLRVFVRYLIEQGLAPAGPLRVATRAGVKDALPVADDIKIGLGVVRVAAVQTWLQVGDERWAASHVDVGNPHAVAFLPKGNTLDELDLNQQPGFDQDIFPDGVNAEFCTELAPGTVAMRVHERGVGETLACGTGIVATAAVYRRKFNWVDPVRVKVPGGQLLVEFDATSDELLAWLTGPAVIVAHGRFLLD